VGVPRIMDRRITRRHHVLGRATRGTIRQHTSIDIEVSVVRCEGSMSPVSLDEPAHVAQSSAFRRLEYNLMGWFLGNGIPLDSWFLKSLIGMLSANNLERWRITVI